jgi:hypothetical protein
VDEEATSFTRFLKIFDDRLPCFLSFSVVEVVASAVVIEVEEYPKKDQEDVSNGYFDAIHSNLLLLLLERLMK